MYLMTVKQRKLTHYINVWIVGVYFVKIKNNEK